MDQSGTFRVPELDELEPLFPQFAIERLVGIGGMGTVFRAIQKSVERPIALKILPPELAKDEGFRERFRLEAKAMAKLHHPLLVQVYDFGEARGGLLWMSLEWLDGETVHCWLDREGALPTSEAAALVEQVCEGLGYAHGMGIVHRDVKPANLMLTPEGQVRVMDFGLAHATRGGPTNLAARCLERYGTREYAAPELFEDGVEIDHRADIFALGVLLYQALTGTLPGAEFHPPSTIKAGLDPRLDRIVAKAMQRKPEHRHASCRELEEELMAVVKPRSSVSAVQPRAGARPVKPLHAAPHGTIAAQSAAHGVSHPTPHPGAHPAPHAAIHPVPHAAVHPASHPAGHPAFHAAEHPLPHSGTHPEVFTPHPAPARKLRIPKIMMIPGVAAVTGLLGWGFWLFLRSNPPEPANPSPVAHEQPLSPTSARPVPSQPATQPAVESPASALAVKRTPGTLDPPKPSTKSLDVSVSPGDTGDPGKVRLAEIDLEVQRRAFAALECYRTAWNELFPRYAAYVREQELAAIKAQQLDRLLFWNREIQVLGRSGEPPAESAGATSEALHLRQRWHEEMATAWKSLDDLRLAHVNDCRMAAEAFDKKQSPASASVLRQRAEAMDKFPAFLALCGWQAPAAPKAPQALAGLSGGEVTIGGTLEELDAALLRGDISRLPAGTQCFEGNHYLRVEQRRTWDEARRWCEERHGHLVTLAGEAEYQWFVSHCTGGITGDSFLGAIASEPGAWKWVTGERWYDNHWLSGEPKGTNPPLYLSWWAARGGFDDVDRRVGSVASGLPYWIEWEKPVTPPPQVATGPLATPGPGFPADLQPLHEVICHELVQWQDDRALRESLIIAYGKTLAGRQKMLNSAGSEAVAATIAELRTMLEKMRGSSPQSQPLPAAKPAATTRSVVDKGRVAKGCAWNEELWKTRAGALESVNQTVTAIESNFLLGSGDFDVRLRLSMGRIGGTRTLMRIGHAYVFLDPTENRIRVLPMGVFTLFTEGPNAATVIRPDTPFELGLKRQDRELTIRIDDKVVLATPIDPGDVGKVAFHKGSCFIKVTDFSVRGNLFELPRNLVTTPFKEAIRPVVGLSRHCVQLLPVRSNDLLVFWCAGPNPDSRSLWMHHSDDAGRTWVGDPVKIADFDAIRLPVSSFAAVASPAGDMLAVLYLTGTSSQRVWCMTGRAAGRNWSWDKPADITGNVKQVGDPAQLVGQAVILRQSRDRMLMPFRTGGQLGLLISDNGRIWRRGPTVFDPSNGIAEIFADDAGQVWMGDSPQKNQSPTGFRRWRVSSDGGDSWVSPAVEPQVPDFRMRGCVIPGVDLAGKRCWYCCTVDGIGGQDPPPRTNLSVFRSFNQGRDWQLLRRVHYGTGAFPNLFQAAQGDLSMVFHAQSSEWAMDSIWAMELPLDWLEEQASAGPLSGLRTK